MSSWQTYTIDDVAEVFDGPHATPTKTESGPWFLSISSLVSGRLKLTESAHLSEADFERWTRRVTPQAGDVLFSYETRLGEAALMPAGVKAALGRRMGLLRPRRKLVEPRFLLLAYLSPQFQEVIRQRQIHGATVDRIPLVDLPRWPIRIPDIPTQRGISSVLGALDDKVAVNERIAETYEDLFRAKFAALGTNEDGDCPVSDLVEFNPRTARAEQHEAVYVDMAALPTQHSSIRAWSRRAPKSGSRFQNGDTLLARITPCLENGKTGYVDFLSDGEVGTGSTEFIVMRPKGDVPPQFPYFLARDERFREHAVRKMVGSSGRQRVSAADAADFYVRRPNPGKLSVFGAEADAAFRHLKSLMAEARSLEHLRDTLLPELMSGRLRVRDAEKAIEDAV
ncbi:restriction endonuclease subunit S [Micromonospora sp. NPDC093277]|uniref:restriction endonuclease subunit S n=1 Tax=Micromonospora sp. NPDC093277 TaxID=3364291 RepID=UPI003822FD51